MPETWTTLRVLSWTADKFKERGIPSARLDAELLLAHVLGVSRVALYTGFERPMEASELAGYRGLVQRRLRGEPVAYLTGKQDFWSLTLAVDARVLIPRPDSETLVEVALRAARALPPDGLRVADIATGSGAIALALATELPGASVVATDLSEDALAVARTNVEALGLAARVELRAMCDLAAPLDGEFGIIVSNPPYVPTPELATLSAEVGHEPRRALDGGADGLAVLRRLVPSAQPRLAPGGLLAVEHAWDQGPRVAALFRGAGYEDVVTAKDLAGRDRVTSGRR